MTQITESCLGGHPQPAIDRHFKTGHSLTADDRDVDRRIERETGVRRETVSAYLKAAGLGVRGRGRPGERTATSAISAEVSTDPPPRPWPRSTRAPQASACEVHRDRIVAALALGRNAMAIYPDLVDEAGFAARNASARRFVGRLCGPTTPEARVVITTAPGQEAPIDDGEGPMLRGPRAETGACTGISGTPESS